MNFVRHIGLALVLAFLTLISCDDDYIQAEGIESYVTLKFINQDSLNLVREKIANFNSLIVAIDARISGIDTAENRLDLQDEKDSLNDLKSIWEDSSTIYKSKRTDINNGRIQIDSIVAISSNKYFTYDKILSKFEVPLNSNSEECGYRISLYDRKDELILSYSIERIFIENQLRAVASNLGVISTTYDSILITCADTTCYTNEALLTIYF